MPVISYRRVVWVCCFAISHVFGRSAALAWATSSPPSSSRSTHNTWTGKKGAKAPVARNAGLDTGIAEAISPSGAGPVQILRGGGERAAFSIVRCDRFHCEYQKVDDGKITFTNPATDQVMVVWEERPRRVLLLLKPEQQLLHLAAETMDFLQREMGLIVYVEENFRDELNMSLENYRLKHGIESENVKPEIRTFRPSRLCHSDTLGMMSAQLDPIAAGGTLQPPDHNGHNEHNGVNHANEARTQGIVPPTDEEPCSVVDMVVTLGGDGLLMHSSTLFKEAVPPHLCFNLGSMGFLTPFESDSIKEEVRRCVDGQEGFKISLRMRLSAKIMRDNVLGCTYHALNEVVVQRGDSPHLSLIECFCDNEYLTTVQADGLIIGTPTGSTAYSMSAGGSMVHPSVPGILFTPICPHSLSFRPLIFPDHVVFRCDMMPDGRADGVVSFDGKHTQALKRGDSLIINMSMYPVPTICKKDSTGDWFHSLDNALGFNTRVRQKALQPSEFIRIRESDQ